MLEPAAISLAPRPVSRKDNVMRYIINGNLYKNNAANLF
jgi:hypothetical protein